MTVRTHEGTIPALPELGQAMSKIGIEVPIPKVPSPGSPDDDGDPDGDDDDGESHFIQDATVLSTLIDAIHFRGQ